MSRGELLVLASALVAIPIVGSAKRLHSAQSSIQEKIAAKRRSTHRLIVRHVSVTTSLLTTLTPDKLARVEPIATVHDPERISAAFDHLDRSQPQPHNDEREMRWHLTFEDRDAKPVLTVATAIGSPRWGTIDAQRVSFGNDAFEKWLRATFAPHEIG